MAAEVVPDSTSISLPNLWHVNCGSFDEFDIMATKDKLMRLLQEMHGLGEVRRPNPVPKHSPLFLTQLRSHMSQTSRPRHRLVINVDVKDSLGFPDPVNITHLKSDSGA